MSEATPSPDPSLSFIPWQLKRDDLLFVLIPAVEKGLQVKGWNLVSNGRRYDNPILAAHLQAGGNYGYYPAPGSSILSVDVDDAGQFHKAGGGDIVGETFRYSAWADRNKYRAIVQCQDMPAHFAGHKISIKDTDYQTIVELFFPANREKTGGQCVGPGSLHPNGNWYSIFDPDASIIPVQWSEIEHLVNSISPDSIKDTIPEHATMPREHGSDKTVTERYGLSVMDNLPLNARMAGNEVRGVHPVHGSTTPGRKRIREPIKRICVLFPVRCGV
jgi:hypothetical protein